MCAWPPYWVVPELRNQVPIGTFVPSGIPRSLEEVDELLRRVLPEALYVGDRALYLHRLVVEGRDVVVGGVQVRRDDRTEDALLVGVVERRARSAS